MLRDRIVECGMGGANLHGSRKSSMALRQLAPAENGSATGNVQGVDLWHNIVAASPGQICV